MSKPRIVINVHGGLVQDVFCSDGLDELIIVDWDVQQGDEGITETVRGRETLRAHVAHSIIVPLDRLAGSDVEAVIEAALESEMPGGRLR